MLASIGTASALSFGLPPFELIPQRPPFPAAELPSRDRKDPALGKRVRALVVDDETNIADSLATILNRVGYEATPVYRGDEALQLARTRCPSLLLTDVLMDPVNGVELAIAVRESCPACHILLITANISSLRLMEQARQRGYDFELLNKPLHPGKLLERLAELGLPGAGSK